MSAVKDLLFKRLITDYRLPSSQYVCKIFEKIQLVFHFTVSGRGAKGDISWWLHDPRRICTSFIVDWRGMIYNLFPSWYYGFHVGASSSLLREMDVDLHNKANIERKTIGVEVDSWGPLMPHNGLYYPVEWIKEEGIYVPNLSMKPLREERIVFFDEPYRGFTAYEKFNDQQIKACEIIAMYCHEKYGIPLTDHTSEMFDVSRNALNLQPGIWTHTSYREDKHDCMPQPEFINMLKNLQKWENYLDKYQ